MESHITSRLGRKFDVVYYILLMIHIASHMSPLAPLLVSLLNSIEKRNASDSGAWLPLILINEGRSFYLMLL